MFDEGTTRKVKPSFIPDQAKNSAKERMNRISKGMFRTRPTAKHPIRRRLSGKQLIGRSQDLDDIDVTDPVNVMRERKLRDLEMSETNPEKRKRLDLLARRSRVNELLHRGREWDQFYKQTPPELSRRYERQQKVLSGLKDKLKKLKIQKTVRSWRERN